MQCEGSVLRSNAEYSGGIVMTGLEQQWKGNDCKVECRTDFIQGDFIE